MKRSKLWKRVQNGPGRSARRAGVRLDASLKRWISMLPPEEQLAADKPAQPEGNTIPLFDGYREGFLSALRREWRDLLMSGYRGGEYIPFTTDKE